METMAVRERNAVARAVQLAGPYVLIELLLPGGTLVALLLFFWRRHGDAAWLRPWKRRARSFARRARTTLARGRLSVARTAGRASALAARA